MLARRQLGSSGSVAGSRCLTGFNFTRVQASVALGHLLAAMRCASAVSQSWLWLHLLAYLRRGEDSAGAALMQTAGYGLLTAPWDEGIRQGLALGSFPGSPVYGGS